MSAIRPGDRAREGLGLHVSGLAKSFGALKVLDGVALDVPAGVMTAVLGPSGCGKTTLLRLVAGFERADAGRIVIGDQVATDVTSGVHLPPERRRIGYVAQEGALFPHLSVAANIGFGLPRAARRGSRIDDLLELVGMPGLGERMPHELSGGQQQRVALARALAPEPALVLLDEPFAALDAGLRANLRADVRSALRAFGATSLLVTHDQGEALSMADQLAVLRGGRLVQTADPETLYREPADAALAEFLGEAVLLPGRAGNGCVDCALGELPVRANGNAPEGVVLVMIRPEQIRLSADGPGIPAHVTASTFYGHDATVELSLDDSETAPRLLARVAGAAPPAVDTAVTVHVAGPVLVYPTS